MSNGPETTTLIALVCDDHVVMPASEPVATQAVGLCWRMSINSGVSGWSGAVRGVIYLAATNANILWTPLIGDNGGEISLCIESSMDGERGSLQSGPSLNWSGFSKKGGCLIVIEREVRLDI